MRQEQILLSGTWYGADSSRNSAPLQDTGGMSCFKSIESSRAPPTPHLPVPQGPLLIFLPPVSECLLFAASMKAIRVLVPAAVLLATSYYVYRRRGRCRIDPFTANTPASAVQLPQDPDGWERFVRDRDKVLRNPYRAAKVPKQVDAIVVGSGIGGLATAVLLARVGKRVLVLEQHDRAGGCCHSFVEQGYDFDPGLHYCGGFHPDRPSTAGFFLNQLTNGQVAWQACDKFYDVAVLHTDGRTEPLRVPMPSGYEDWKNALKSHFPTEGAAIDRFIDYCTECRVSSVGFFLLKVLPRWLAKLAIRIPVLRRRLTTFKSDQTTLAVLRQLTDNTDLQTLLAYHWGDYGTDPARSSFAMHAQLATHFMDGAYYPVGGASMIPFALAPQVTAAGGAVLTQARVQRLLTEGGRVVGVVMQRDGAEIRAPWVVSDAGLVNTGRLLPEPLLRGPARRNGAAPDVSPAYVSIFVGLRGSAEDLGLRATHYWVIRGDGDAEAFVRGSYDEALRSGSPYVFVTFPSAKDPTAAQRAPGKSTCSIVFFASAAWFAEWRHEPFNRRSRGYREAKEALGRRVWDQACALPELAHLRQRVDYFDVGTPLTNEHFLADPSIYGLAHGLERFRPETVLELRPDFFGLRGLALTGKDIFVCGFSGALTSGLLTASHVLGRDLYADLSKARKAWEAGRQGPAAAPRPQ